MQPHPSTGNHKSIGKSEAQIAEEALTAGSAQSLLEVVGPKLDRQTEALIGGFVNCPADLGQLLQFQAKIAALWHLKKELNDIAKRGKPALEAFDQLLRTKRQEVEE